MRFQRTTAPDWLRKNSSWGCVVMKEPLLVYPSNSSPTHVTSLNQFLCYISCLVGFTNFSSAVGCCRSFYGAQNIGVPRKEARGEYRLKFLLLLQNLLQP